MSAYVKSQSSFNEQNNNLNEAADRKPSSRQSSKQVSSSAAGADLKRASLSSSNSDEMRAMSINAEYDKIRNQTLMFFLDRLFIASKEGKETHTLHDLSCLFGSREFTKEMRQIVGASRNGLKKFLQSYPSLFTIDQDRVYLTQLEKDSKMSARDYDREAVEYFRDKLSQFGVSLVPIRNLFGYRSQASQEVRHVSGKNSKEFEEFLSAHSDIFELLPDEHVMLKSALHELESRGESLGNSLINHLAKSSEDACMDPYLNKQFASFIEQSLRKMLDNQQVESESEESRVKMEILHEKILQQCDNQLFLAMVRTLQDFKRFLRMHPKIFKRSKREENQEEFVGVVSDQERREMELQSMPQLSLRRCNTNESNLSSLSSNLSSSQQQPQSLPPFRLASQQTDKSSSCNRTKINETPSSGIGDDDKQLDCRSIASSCSDVAMNSISGQSSLRATAKPFVPSAYCQSLDGTGKSNVSLSDNQNNSTSRSSAGQQVATARRQIDPHHHQALRAHIMKNAPINQSGNQANNATRNQPLARHNTNSESGDLRARTVDMVREASTIITKIMDTADAVAFDCKGYNLGSNGQITLIQFGYLPQKSAKFECPKTESHKYLQRLNQENEAAAAAENGQVEHNKPEVCLFDLITNPELAYCLKPLLESERVVKIVHDVRNKSNALYAQFNIVLRNVFDTQVANLVIQQQETGKPAYKSRYISMGRLCEIYGDANLIKYRNMIKSRTRHSASVDNQSRSGNCSSLSGKSKDANYWRTRPMTEPMIFESTMDVYCLVGCVYQNLKSKIKPEYEPLFEQLNMEGVYARIKPEEIRSVKKERKIDLEVIDLKQKLYNEAIGSIVLSNREIRLLRHIDLTEEVRQKIQQCKKVAKKLERLDMKAAQNAQLEDGSSSVDCESDQAQDKSRTNDMSHNSMSSAESSSGEHSNESKSFEEDIDQVVELTSLIDSSMFDELKEKMIESSSLLASLEDDDDDDDDAAAADQVNGHESCRCNCHQADLSDRAKQAKESIIKCSSSSSPNMASNISVEPKAVDMAIQCDLLS